MKIEEIRALDPAAIRENINTQQRDLMGARMSNKIGNLDNPVEIRERRKNIARLKTVLAEKTAN